MTIQWTRLINAETEGCDAQGRFEALVSEASDRGEGVFDLTYIRKDGSRFHDALWTTDPSGIIIDVNREMEALTECSREELIGAPFKGCFADPQRAEMASRRALRDGKVSRYELTACAKDGKRTAVAYSAITFYDRNGTLQGVLAAAREVTERPVASDPDLWSVDARVHESLRQGEERGDLPIAVMTAQAGYEPSLLQSGDGLPMGRMYKPAASTD